MNSALRPLLAALLLIVAVAGAGCAARSAPSEEAESSGAAALTDAAYLTGSHWNDGRAEVAFYRVERSKDQYGRPGEQSFVAGTYLVKHHFDPQAMTKATGGASEAPSAFKYALFYEFESGSYQFKRNYVTNARQKDLRPLKASFTSFDWCSNLYEELAFQPSGTVRRLKRSDDYGNAQGSFDYQPGAFPTQMLPLLMRGLDFSAEKERAFQLVLPGGQYVQARARLAGADSLALPAGRTAAERITVTYEQPVPSMIGEETGTEETYWRSTDSARRLLKVKGATYQMQLVEVLRTPYWKENLWPKLARIEARP